MKSFLVGLLVLLMFALLSLLVFLLIPFLIVMGLFLKVILGLVFVIFAVWLVGKATLLLIESLNKPTPKV